MGNSLAVRFAFIFLAALGAGVFYWGTYTGFTIPDIAVDAPPRKGTVVFVGDVMLARHVERHMRERGGDYPFRDVSGFLKEYDHVVGNFEATIPETHVPTEPMTMRFSVDAVFAPELASAGFTLMTLANNHAFDHGASALANTKEVLANAGVEVVGHPNRVTKDDIAFLDANGVSVAIIPVHAVSGVSDLEAVIAAIRDVTKDSDVQIISIHWGDEYEPLSNDYQRSLAHAFIDAGADAVIGHHPHVVQQIETYNGAPIFYSLGNFIFDQYWNDDVKEGLAVAITADAHRLVYTLLPVRSDQSAPAFMTGRAREIFLQKLADRSDLYLASGIKDGAFALDLRTLASSGMTAMIGTY